MKRIKRNELSKYNGNNGMPIYIAYNSFVYDVTSSFLWKGSRHQVLHKAGKDLTEELKQAPHGKDLLKRVPVIGRLAD